MSSQPLRQLFLNEYPTPKGLTDNEHILANKKSYEAFSAGVIAGLKYAVSQVATREDLDEAHRVA